VWPRWPLVTASATALEKAIPYSDNVQAFRYSCAAF
jgi:hypothetical protein